VKREPFRSLSLLVYLDWRLRGRDKTEGRERRATAAGANAEHARALLLLVVAVFFFDGGVRLRVPLLAPADSLMFT